MKMNNEKTIEVLNTLIQINNDRIEGYETASDETLEQDLKTLFSKLAQTSIDNNRELTGEVSMLGGVPTDSTKTAGKFFRVWMDVKAALTNNDRKLILNSCEYGEDNAKNTYAEALKNDTEYLTSDQIAMIRLHYAQLMVDHDNVKYLRDATEV